MTVPSDWVRFFYVSAADAGRRFLVAGPYPTQQAAQDRVRDVLHEADRRDPRAWFMGWGTAGTDHEVKTPLGVF